MAYLYLFYGLPLNFGCFLGMSEGRHGKNRTWPMGYHWLVALFLLSATVIADPVDVNVVGSYGFYNILDQIKNNQTSSISDISQITDNTYDMASDLSLLRAEIEDFLSQVSISINPSGTQKALRVLDFSVSNAVSVFDDHTTSRLDRIIDILSNSGFTYTNFYIPSGNSFLSPMGIPPNHPWAANNITSMYDDYLKYYEYIAKGDQVNARNQFLSNYQKYGEYKWTAIDLFYKLDYGTEWVNNYSLYGSLFKYRVDKFVNSSSDSILQIFLDTYRENYYNQYAVLPFRNMVSNFLYSAYHNGTFDAKILAQLANPDEVNALVSSSQFAGSVSNSVSSLDNSGLVSTNGVYYGNYETNGVLAEITTNNYHNSGYSSFADNMTSNAIARKITSFNFEQKFDEGLKPFLDEINAGSGSDWIINFGNITLGDFSYTIPAVTLQRNTVYLSYVDRAFNIMKAISTVCFFLLLWNSLLSASKDG